MTQQRWQNWFDVFGFLAPSAEFVQTHHSLSSVKRAAIQPHQLILPFLVFFYFLFCITNRFRLNPFHIPFPIEECWQSSLLRHHSPHPPTNAPKLLIHKTQCLKEYTHRLNHLYTPVRIYRLPRNDRRKLVPSLHQLVQF